MDRLILRPELEINGKDRIWRRVFYSVVLTSVEFFLALICIFAGLPVLLDPFTLSLVPDSVTHLLALWMVDVWGVQLTLGGGLTVFGIVKDDYRIEQIGVLFLGSGAFVYMLALIAILPGSWVAFITYLFFVLAMIARYWVLGRLIKATGKLRKKVLDALPDKE